MLGRGRLFKKPDDGSDDDDDGDAGGREVYAKPVKQSVASRLDGSYQPRQFVTASGRSQAEFYGGQHVEQPSSTLQATNERSSNKAQGVSLTDDERNKLSARIFKAEMAGKTELVKSLRAQLDGFQPALEKIAPAKSANKHDDRNVLLTRTDVRTGVTMPITEGTRTTHHSDANTSLRSLVEEERNTTADDQLAMLGSLASRAMRTQRTDDDTTVDDLFVTAERPAKRKRREELDEQHRRKQHIEDYKRQQQTLDSCTWCWEGERIDKQRIVAVGIKTYLCAPTSEPLVDGHLCIVPMVHVASTVQLDEDVHDEMRLWRRGLVAMYGRRLQGENENEDEEDCIFMETANRVRQQMHMLVDSVPVPRAIGDTAPIYFKKAIQEHGSEWADNVKLIDLSKKDLRHSVPKGFPYFAVDFGLQSGYAHVIENEQTFAVTFGTSIVGGMLDLEHNRWRRPRALRDDELREYVRRMRARWAPYDWTERARAALQ